MQNQPPNAGGLFNALMQRAQQGQGQPAPKGPAQGIWSPKPPQSGMPPQGGPPQGPPGPGGPTHPPPPQGPPQGPPAPPMPTPAVMPNPHAKVPPAAERFQNGQNIQQAYANGWQPNPVLLRASLGR